MSLQNRSIHHGPAVSDRSPLDPTSIVRRVDADAVPSSDSAPATGAQANDAAVAEHESKFAVQIKLDERAAALLKSGDAGIVEFVNRVYRTIGMSTAAVMVGSLVASQLITIPVGAISACVATGSITGLLAWALIKFARKPITLARVNPFDSQDVRLYTVNSTGRKLIYGAFLAGKIIAFTPIMQALSSSVGSEIAFSLVGTTSIVLLGISALTLRFPFRSQAMWYSAYIAFFGLALFKSELSAALAASAEVAPAAELPLFFTMIPIAAVFMLSDRIKSSRKYVRGHADHLLRSLQTCGLGALVLVGAYSMVLMNEAQLLTQQPNNTDAATPIAVNDKANAQPSISTSTPRPPSRSAK